MCNALVNEESVRVLYKNKYRFGVKLLNIYMTFGGMTWGNLGYEGGDSSYDLVRQLLRIDICGVRSMVKRSWKPTS